MQLFDKVKKKLQPKPTPVKVCMMGARGVGKTSVLTSMFHDLNEVNKCTSLQLIAQGGDGSETDREILEKGKELRNMFLNASPCKKIQDAGIAANFDVRKYFFEFGLKGEYARMQLEITDYPGEFVRDSPDTVKAFLQESTAVLIAIDTPHLMEADGTYCEAKNTISHITNFFQSIPAEDLADRIILLVPLKCEKYYKEGRIDEVSKKVQVFYKSLIEYLTSTCREKCCTCAITPIMTVGDVEFDDFLRKEDGSIRTVESWNGLLPAKAIYRFCDVAAPQYNPKYCEQPLCYLLSFITRQYARSKNSKDAGFLKKLASILKLFPDDPSLLLEINRFAKRKVVDKDGYCVLFGKEFI